MVKSSNGARWSVGGGSGATATRGAGIAGGAGAVTAAVAASAAQIGQEVAGFGWPPLCSPPDGTWQIGTALAAASMSAASTKGNRICTVIAIIASAARVVNQEDRHPIRIAPC